MQIHITYGTIHYLSSMKEKHPSENLLLMTNENTSALLHETEGSSLFNEPKIYEIIDRSGPLNNDGFAVLNNIPVREEGRALFEDRFQNRPRAIEHEPGFKAIRVLRPSNTDTYIILTVWEKESDFKNWQNSKAYEEAHKNRGTSEGIDRSSIFASPSYVTTFQILKEE